MQIYSCTPYAVFSFRLPPPPSATFSHFTLHFKKPLKWQIGCAALRYRTHPTSSGRESVNFISATGNCVYGVALQQARHCPPCPPCSPGPQQVWLNPPRMQTDCRWKYAECFRGLEGGGGGAPAGILCVCSIYICISEKGQRDSPLDAIADTGYNLLY